ncbi:MAG: signal peptide peptidase SppA [Deltaproteobacteria bacterium]|nr:signal peptide peptidase SppA [Deltaproteobacteria bacterium]
MKIFSHISRKKKIRRANSGIYLNRKAFWTSLRKTNNIMHLKNILIFPLVLIFLVLSGCFFPVIDKEKILSGPAIGIIEIKGVIEDSKTILKNLKKFASDSNIKGILIRVDSPGGTVGPTQEIYSEIRKTSKKKKVYISIGNVAASGGYYIASAGDKIFANPGSITGSIGVIMQAVNIEQLVKFMKIDVETIKSGKYKDMGTPFKELTNEEREMLLGVTRDIHNQFIEDVARARKTDIEKIREIADGRIMTGLSAKQYGLVDEIGSIEDATETLWKDLELSGEPRTTYPRRQTSSFFREFMDSLSEDVEERLGISKKGLSFWFLSYYGTDTR